MRHFHRVAILAVAIVSLAAAAHQPAPADAPLDARLETGVISRLRYDLDLNDLVDQDLISAVDRLFASDAATDPDASIIAGRFDELYLAIAEEHPSEIDRFRKRVGLILLASERWTNFADSWLTDRIRELQVASRSFGNRLANAASFEAALGSLRTLVALRPLDYASRLRAAGVEPSATQTEFYRDILRETVADDTSPPGERVITLINWAKADAPLARGLRRRAQREANAAGFTAVELLLTHEAHEQNRDPERAGTLRAECLAIARRLLETADATGDDRAMRRWFASWSLMYLTDDRAECAALAQSVISEARKARPATPTLVRVLLSNMSALARRDEDNLMLATAEAASTLARRVSPPDADLVALADLARAKALAKMNRPMLPGYDGPDPASMSVNAGFAANVWFSVAPGQDAQRLITVTAVSRPRP